MWTFSSGFQTLWKILEFGLNYTEYFLKEIALKSKRNKILLWTIGKK